MNKPPVFVVSGKDPTRSPGGYAAYSHNLCQILVELGLPVYIIAAGRRHTIRRTKLGELHLVPNALANRMPVLGSVEMAMMPVYAFSFAKEIRSIVQKNRYNAFTVWGMGPWSFTGAILKHTYGGNVRLLTSYFTTFRHEMAGSLVSIMTPDYPLSIKFNYILVSFVGGALFTLIERYTLTKTDTVVTHYQSTETILQKELNVPHQKMKRISYYVEVFDRSPSVHAHESSLRKNISRPVLLTVCRQDARKGINFFLHAIKLLKERGIHCSCVIIGSGTLLELNKRLAQKLGIFNVYFLGFQPKIDDLYKQTDVFVLSSTEEGSGSLSLLEAMREGLPIVATRIDGVEEDVVHKKSALLVNRASARDLASAIEVLLKNPKQARSLGASAKHAYKKRFSFDTMKRDVSKLLMV